MTATLAQPSVGASVWFMSEEHWLHLGSRTVVLAWVLLLHLAGLMLLQLTNSYTASISGSVEITLLAAAVPATVRPVTIPEPALPLSIMQSVMPEVQVQQAPAVFAQVAPPAPVPPVITPAMTTATSVPAEATLNIQTLETQCPVHPAPVYPAQAKRLREQGTVVLGIALDEQGNVMSVQVSQSSGSPRLDTAGVAAMRRWQCRPALRDGQPVPATARHEFEFVLTAR